MERPGNRIASSPAFAADVHRPTPPLIADANMVEEGSALEHFTGVAGVAAEEVGSQKGTGAAPKPERHRVVVIGGGQSGLSVGYHLARLGVPFVILDAMPRIGDAWRRRWDSLRLFTPARFDGLDGMPFPAHGDVFPTKDEMADYLEAYARRFALPTRTGVRVDRVSRRNGRYEVTAGASRFEADHVVVAMSSFQKPRVPSFARDLDPKIVQLHSYAYRNPEQLREGDVLIVGAGNSGSEIAMELLRKGRSVWMSGRNTGHIPFRPSGLLGRKLMVRVVLRWIFHRLFTVDTPVGRKMRRKFVHQGGPLIRVKPRDLAAAGVRRVPRVAGVRDGRPVLEDGRALDVTNVIWCTGFHNDFSWIDCPVFDETGIPIQYRGQARGEPDLHFIGLEFLYSASSPMVHGVGRDARRVAERIAARAGVA